MIILMGGNGGYMRILFLVMSILVLGFHCLFEIGNVYVLKEQMKSESSSLEEDYEDFQ
jgi:hypothetical protein